MESGDCMDVTEKIKKAGVVGAGGAGFPTHVKLNAKAEYLIINAAECEPLIEIDKYLCRTYADRIVKTVDSLAKFLQAEQAVIALKGKYKSEIAALSNAIRSQHADIRIHQMDTFYPAGDEQIMVHEVTGRVVPERGLPLDVGCVVDNVGTILAIADAIEDKPVTDKILSVTGDVEHPLLFQVPIGTSVRFLLDQAGLSRGTYGVINGGPMMGKVLHGENEIDEAVVTKTTGNLLVLPKDHYLMKRSALSVNRMAHQGRSACIQCRMCTDLCPRYLIGHDVQPHLVMRNLYRENTDLDREEYKKAFGSALNCCSCGICEMFSCPMGLSPRKMNDYVKGRLRTQGIQVEKNHSPSVRDGWEHKKIPTSRLTARLGLSKYVSHEVPDDVVQLQPDCCFIPLSQHIGKPAVPVVENGNRVEKGTLVAGAAEGLSANIYSGMTGIVTEVTKRGIRISRKGD